MTATTAPFMTRLAATPVSEILGNYQALLDAKHDLEIEALALRDEGESLGSARSLANRQARNDVERRLGIYEQLAAEAERILAVSL